MPMIDDPYSHAQLESARSQIEGAHGEALSIGQECYERICNYLSEREYEAGTAHEIAYALAARVLELAAMSLICLRSGSVPSAKVLIRTVLEATYKSCALLIDPKNIDQLLSDDIAARLLLNKKVHQYKKEKGAKHVAVGIERKIDALALHKATKIEPAEWSQRAKMTDFHLLFYPWLSSDTHTNVAAIDHYFDEAQDYSLQIGPEDTHLRITLMILSRCLLALLQRLEAPPSETSDAWHKTMDNRLLAIEAT